MIKGMLQSAVCSVRHCQTLLPFLLRSISHSLRRCHASQQCFAAGGRPHCTYLTGTQDPATDYLITDNDGSVSILSVPSLLSRSRQTCTSQRQLGVSHARLA